MQEILDQPFNENEKDETWINRGIALIRILVSFYLSNHLILFWDNYYTITINTYNIILTSTFFLVIVHTIYRILSELRKRFIIPKENKVLILFMIFIYLIPTGVVLYYVFDKLSRNSLLDFRIGNADLFLLPLGLLIIIFREIIYYRRLKRLKNQANG